MRKRSPLPAKTDLVLTDREVALSDLVLGIDLELLWQLLDEELPLDLGSHLFISFFNWASVRVFATSSARSQALRAWATPNST